MAQKKLSVALRLIFHPSVPSAETLRKERLFIPSEYNQGLLFQQMLLPTHTDQVFCPENQKEGL